jgi:hypothetical protein
MFEICFMDDTDLAGEVEDQLLAYLDGVLARYDLVLVADYGHGMVRPGLVTALCEKAPFLAVNTRPTALTWDSTSS